VRHLEDNGSTEESEAKWMWKVDRKSMEIIVLWSVDCVTMSRKLGDCPTYCTVLGLLDQFWTPIVPFYAIEDAVRIGNYFITIPITHNYIHSQLLLKLLRVYTAYNHTRS
jgi:hypothetical protein